MCRCIYFRSISIYAYYHIIIYYLQVQYIVYSIYILTLNDILLHKHLDLFLPAIGLLGETRRHGGSFLIKRWYSVLCHFLQSKSHFSVLDIKWVSLTQVPSYLHSFMCPNLILNSKIYNLENLASKAHLVMMLVHAAMLAVLGIPRASPRHVGSLTPPGYPPDLLGS